MQSRTESRVEGWDSRPFEGGYAGLRDLADRDFSGVVRSGGAWLFMLNGRVVGVNQGSMADFEGADGTTYAAPDPSLPLLFSMQERDGSVQAKYYTNDTPISEAVQTLTDSNFTGYIELSENVLSGDYYVVFYGGRSMSAAFVGNNETLLTGDEAFNRADDEVGIYEVISVDVEVTDVPEPSGGDPTDAGGAAAGAGAAGTGTGAGGGTGPDGGLEGAGETPAGDEPVSMDGTDSDPPSGGQNRDAASDPLAPADAAESGATGDDVGGTGAETPESPGGDRTSDTTSAPPTERGSAETDAGSREPTPEPEPNAAGASSAVEQDPTRETSPHDGDSSDEPDSADSSDDQPGTESAAASAAREAADATSQSGASPANPPSDPSTADGPAQSSGGSADASSDGHDASSDGPGGVTADEREWQETRTIPSIDPSRSAGAGLSVVDSPPATGDGGETTVGSGSTDRGGPDPPPGASSGGDATGTGTDPTTTPTASGAQSGPTDPVEEAVNSQRVAELEDELEDREAQINRLERKLTDVQVERDSLAEERSALKAEIGQLEGEIEDLEARIAQLQDSVEGETAVGTQLDPETALEQTNLFVRYGTKSGGTLAKAHDGEVDAQEVNNNLRLEHHTQFDDGQTSVDGRPFGEFLPETMEFRFVRWVVEHLLYEIRGTGHQKALRSLYDAIPKIDRAELKGSVSVRYTKDGEEYREQQRFDVVMRDRMGNPLLVANLNDSRNPASEEMMVGMIEAAGKVKRTSEALSTAMLVTASFFEPQALEEADEATSGGFLGRDSRDSFVKLSRKQGYHLCLVESRGGEFHLTMPEL